ncbi:hypothetical protein HX875_06295 [Pseudomonas yamanorum]|jgi:hypothetical protein|uniref:Uncharacterized protein n=1 Tax=Pseudomonas yamanorum TaxID=515393 RepID=A0A7Y8FA81_9PSED|nr:MULTISPECIES: hypothetical protein [Pseudomonas]NVZ81237.1 hypothetical protein [Pseudomonas yamanorum]NWD22452.1 hypothetical protein [Pseudomonas yamanorum]NWE39074.1 hypothetical protein [Pseudomonas yamanorum]NWE74916.1 hypothetical protein [Pseudomonas yamanorum]
MLRIAACSLLALLASQPALAEQTFQCGNATVTISIDTTSPLRSIEGVDVMLRVDQGPRSTLLRYSNIDFIGGDCDTDARGNPIIVYQAICGGSGCYDLSNWGLIDPVNLQALLAPADDSLVPATRLLGHPPVLKVPKMSLSTEAHRLGLPTP